MSKLEFSINLSASHDKIMKLALDYEKLPNFLPDQLQKVVIISQDAVGVTTTEETLVFSTIIKNQIVQRTTHKQLEDQITSNIISGPAKGSIIETRYEKIDSGTKVTVIVTLKLNLKAKFLQPIIKKWYKSVLTGILYKMNTVAQMQQN